MSDDREALARSLAALTCMRRSGETPAALRARDAAIARLEARLAQLQPTGVECSACGEPGATVLVADGRRVSRLAQYAALHDAPACLSVYSIEPTDRLAVITAEP